MEEPSTKRWNPNGCSMSISCQRRAGFGPTLATSCPLTLCVASHREPVGWCLSSKSGGVDECPAIGVSSSIRSREDAPCPEGPKTRSVPCRAIALRRAARTRSLCRKINCHKFQTMTDVRSSGLPGIGYGASWRWDGTRGECDWPLSALQSPGPLLNAMPRKLRGCEQYRSARAPS
jgi:hypothetical protein